MFLDISGTGKKSSRERHLGERFGSDVTSDITVTQSTFSAGRNLNSETRTLNGVSHDSDIDNESSI